MVWAELGLAKATAIRQLDDLLRRILAEAKNLYAEIEAENAALLQARPGLAATLAGETRALRAILHTVIKDMVRQVA